MDGVRNRKSRSWQRVSAVGHGVPAKRTDSVLARWVWQAGEWPLVAGVRRLGQAAVTAWGSNETARGKRLRIIAVAVFSISFFGSLFSFLLKPPGAAAVIADGDGVTIYGLNNNSTPKTRDYIEATDSFTTEANTVSGTAEPTSITLKTSTIKTEAIAAYTVSGGTLRVMCFDGTNWSNEWTATVTSTASIRPYEVAYETQSGNVVVLYGTGSTTSNELAYRTKPGTASCGSGNWSAATNVTAARTNGSINWVEMASDPNSDTIAAIWAESNRDLSGMIWDSSTQTWGNEPSSAFETTVETSSSTTRSDIESFDLAYESVSGDLMVAWGQNGTGSGLIEYQACTGGGASCTWGSAGDVPTVADTATAFDMTANPQTNEIVFGAIDNGGGGGTPDLSIGYWNGSSWTGLANVDTSCDSIGAGYHNVTVNWLINGSTTRSLVVYADQNSQAIDYYVGNGATFTVGTDFDTTTGLTPAFGTTLLYYKASKDPYHLNRVMLEIADNNARLYAKHVAMSASGTLTWTNSDGGAALQTALSTSTAGPFGFDYWQYVPQPGPAKLSQDGYIFENDDQVVVGGNTTDGNSVQAVANTPITGVRRGERLTIRFQLRNTGVDPLTGGMGLFYDRNDGYFVKAGDHSPPNTATGDCTDNHYNCAVVDNAAGTNTGQYASMAFDNAGQSWVSYYDATNTRLVVAKYVGYGGTGCGATGSTAWTCTVVDQDAGVTLGQYTSMGFDTAGVPWVSYYDATNTNLKVAKLHTDTTTNGTGCGTGGSTKWDCVTVDSTANMTGQYTSIAFSQSGAPGVAYTYNNGTLAGVKFANYVGTGGTGCATTAWTCVVLDEGSATGIDYTTVQYDHGNKPWVAYYDKSATALGVANYVGGTNGTGCGATGSAAWTCTEIDNNADDGQYPNLTLGPAGNIWVSYYDATNTALRVATRGGSFGSACTASGWTCGTVDNTGTNTGTYSALAQDASGQLIVSYYDATNTALRVARYVGGTSGNCTANSWNCGAVDNNVGGSTDTGQYSTAATAPDGNLWVSYYDATNTALRTAQVTRGGEIIPSAGLAGYAPASITASHADMTGVGDTTNKSDADCLTAGATWNNGVWGSGSEAQTNQTSGTNSILPAGNLVAQCTEVAFTIDTSQATAGATYRFIVASSTSDRKDRGIWRGPIAVSYYATLTISSAAATERFSKDTNPSFPTCDGNSSWGCEALQSTNNVGQYSSLAFDPAGYPWISYYDSSNTAMRVARYVGSGGTGCATTEWTCIQMENQSGRTTGQYSSIAFAKDGTPWVAYRDNSTSIASGGLKVANKVSASGTCASIGGSAQWDCTRIDGGTGSGTGLYTSIAISPSGNPWIAYQELGTQSLRLAMYVGSGGSGCGGQPSAAWSCFTVDDGGDFGESAHLGFDGDGTAWISYYDSNQGALKVAKYVGSGGAGCTSTQWQCEWVESLSNTGPNFTSMAFGTNGRPYISYYDAFTTELKVARYVGSGGTGCDTATSWTCTSVDNTNAMGQYSSIAFDATGNPWVSYYNASNSALRLARYVGSGSGTGCSSADWTCTDINTANTVGLYTSLAFDHSGDPWVSYYDSTNLDLRIAKQSMPTAKPSAQEVLSAGRRSARMNDARWHLDNGLAPRDSTGDCNAVANNMGYCGVRYNDGYYDSLYVNPNEQPFFLFAFRRTDNTLPAFVQWTGSSAVSSATAPIRLEVYNNSTSTWDTILTQTSCSAGSGCRLIGAPSGTLANYYDADGSGNYWIYFRVSQAASTTGGLFQTNTFMFAPTTDLLMRHGEWFDPSSQQADRSQPFFWVD